MGAGGRRGSVRVRFGLGSERLLVAPWSREVFPALRVALKGLGSGEVGDLPRLPAAAGRRCQPPAGTRAGSRGGLGGADGGEGLQIGEGEKERIHNIH